VTDRPHAICQACFDVQSKIWISRTWLYCRHFRVMARRRRREDAWTLDRNTSPGKAHNHLQAALAKMRTQAESRGIRLDEAVALVQWLAEQGRGF